MPIYAIGDIQGCFTQLEKLLAKIKFDSLRDTLWFTGDLVNRGPDSLATIRFVKSLGSNTRTVLGNHDLHLLAVAYGDGELRKNDTMQQILDAPDRDDLIEWLRHRPLLVYENNYVLVHAGLAPEWTIEQAESHAREVEAVLQGTSASEFLKHMYGNKPDHWHSDLQGVERYRCIVNYFTRMRLCYPDGRLELDYKGTMQDKPTELIPWFDVAGRHSQDLNIIFGHWAALGGIADVPNVYPLDTGCVWGACLTAMRLEDGERFSVECG